jgi:hypothetical protein
MRIGNNRNHSFNYLNDHQYNKISFHLYQHFSAVRVVIWQQVSMEDVMISGNRTLSWHSPNLQFGSWLIIFE